jgi:multidrug efflux system outer membrane protein
MMTRKNKVGALMLALTMAGCSTMAPKYTQPAAPVAAAWPSGPSYQAVAASQTQKLLADIPWRDYFVDERLQKLITLGLKNNRDLRVALLGIERFQAQFQIQRSNLLPKVNATGGANFQRIPDGLSATGKTMTVDQYNVGAGLLSYELDLFGRVRSLKDLALEQYLASDQARRSTQISLVSQIATGYLTLAADRERLKLAKDTLASQQESYQLIQRRFEAGVSSALDLQQARTTVDAARIDIARFTTLAAQDENALNQLIGSPVPAEFLPATLSETITAVKDVSPGLPSDVLLRRPDILQAEEQLKGANANIGAARAAFFPKVTLVSSIGFGSSDLAGLFKSGAFAWSIAPSISMPIFDGGSNKANLKVAEVDRDIAIAQYEKAIQAAFREVADTLAQRGTIDEQLAAQQSLVDATGERYRLSMARFEKGVDSHLNVLDSQRSLYAAQQNLIGTRFSRLTSLVTMYKVLGGGDAD